MIHKKSDPMQISTTLQQMTLQEIVLAVLLQKNGTAYFRREALERGFKHVAAQHRPLQGLFSTQMDPATKKQVIALHRILAFLDRFQIVKDTGDSEHMFLTKTGKQYAESTLKENHGNDILEKVSPLSQSVWAYVDTYTRMMEF